PTTTVQPQQSMYLIVQHLICKHKSNVFFFQAEDGIRDDLVTGVQTCALPISPRIWRKREIRARIRTRTKRTVLSARANKCPISRSEERRVGKSVDLGGRSIDEKKRGRQEVASEEGGQVEASW